MPSQEARAPTRRRLSDASVTWDASPDSVSADLHGGSISSHRKSVDRGAWMFFRGRWWRVGFCIIWVPFLGVSCVLACVRNYATSLVRQAAIFGLVFDPILIWLGRKNELWSYGVFGMAITPCGLLVLCLLETRGKSLCDTMEEQEWSDAGVAAANTSIATHSTA
ncbi:hypothetical protein Cgig2_020344 [Carnegiea gigantea]|uniref:Uncharacterized protein n=1 Tax=Carnegiea gigantea TaxID=171969 RepID=A0A9Q1KCX1_9CARY|nr:hypothetical protein Cgig2_020344 [Carnegiea gigantea]